MWRTHSHRLNNTVVKSMKAPAHISMSVYMYMYKSDRDCNKVIALAFYLFAITSQICIDINELRRFMIFYYEKSMPKFLWFVIYKIITM